MNLSRDIHLNIPSCAVKYKLSLDDLDLALLPMSRLMNNYGLGSPRSQPESLKDEAFDGPRDRVLVGQQGGDFKSQKVEDVLDVQQLGCLEERPDSPVVDFVATVERNGYHEPDEPKINQAKYKRLTRFCHICNIAVPKIYAKDHNRSKLHCTLLQLANEAVSRLNKHIQQQLSENDDTSYCAPCNEEVESVADHEKDIRHKHLREREELLTTLLYIYTEDQEALDERTKHLINKIESQTQPDNACLNEVKSSNMPAQTDNNKVVTIKNITNAKIVAEVSHNLEKPVTLESNGDLGKNADNSAIIVNDPSQAKLEKQERSVAKPTNEPSGSIAASSDKDTYYLCKICNESVPNNILNITHHNNYSSAHIANVEKLQGADKKSVSKEPDTTGHYYNICAIKVPSKASNIIEHDNGTAHKAKLEQLKNGTANEPKACSSFAPQKPTHLLAGPSVIPDLSQAAKVAIAAGFYFCNVCAVSVPNNDGNITRHNNGARHKTKIEELQAAGTHKGKNNTPAMSRVIPAKETHQSQPTSFKAPIKPAQAFKLNQYYCNVCAVYVPNNVTNITGHNNGVAHRANLDDSRKREGTQNVNTTSVNTNSYAKIGLARVNDYCTVCGVNAGVGNFEQHLISRSHKDRVLYGNITDETAGYNFCRLCNFEMPNRYKVIDEHYSGKSHKSNFDKYLAKNTIVDLGGNQIQCKVCSKSMHLSFVWGHINNEYHVANLKNHDIIQKCIQAIPDF